MNDLVRFEYESREVRVIREFHDEVCYLNPESVITVMTLYRAFKEWSFSKYGGYLGKNFFIKLLIAYFTGRVKHVRVQGGASFTGIGIQAPKPRPLSGRG
jgi:hypothetical protein